MMKTDIHPSDMDKPPIPLEMNVMATTAQEVTQHFDLLEDGQSLLTATQTPAEFLQCLWNNGHYHDAVAFLAHAIPISEAVWWTCVCARSHVDDSDEQYQEALTAAETWVRAPTEKNRRNAEKCAEEGNYDTLASWAAAAAFWSGGSVAPIGEPPMDPPAYLHGKAVVAAIIMSANLGMPAVEDVAERYQNYLHQGILIANSDRDPWQ